MTAPADIDVLGSFFDDINELDFEGDSTSSAEDFAIQRACLYVIGSLLSGGWSDTTEMDPVVCSFLESLPCYPLLKPWLEQRRWTADEVTALKVELEMVKA